MANLEDSDDDEEVAAALEARLSTLQHLSPEEAATMLARMPPHQAGQLVLLMGSGNRDRILAALSDTAKAAVAATLPADAAEALGLCATAASTEADADKAVVATPAVTAAFAGSGYPSSDLPSRQAEEACPEHQQQQQHHETEKLKAQPDFLEEDEHHATDEMHNAERGRAADASAQQAAAEPLSGEMPGLDPATQEQEEDAEACKIHEPGTVATEAEDPAISSSHLSNGKLLDSSRDDGADHDTVRGKDEAGAQSSSPLPTDHKPASSATISAQEEDVEPEIIDTWLVDNKPPVREHPSLFLMEAPSLRAEAPPSDAAQVALHLSPLPNATIARYFQETPGEEWEDILVHFPPERRKSIMEILGELEDTSSSISESSSNAMPARMSRAMGMAGTFAARAKQGISEMAPEASHKAAYATAEMKRAAAAASHAAVWARHSVTQAADKAAATKSAERAKTAASSAMSAARVSVSSAAHKAEFAVTEAAGAARHGVSHLVSTSSASDAVESSGRLARQMTTEAKQKVSGATEVAKAQLASVSKGMAGFFRK